MQLEKKKVYVLVFLIIVIITLAVINYTKNCGYDTKCFDNYAAKCSKASVLLMKENDEYKYDILGPKGDSCVMTIYLVKVNEDTPADARRLIEGKGMICEVPDKEIKGNTLTGLKSINDYCTGPLKEAILQMGLENLYELVVKALGPGALGTVS